MALYNEDKDEYGNPIGEVTTMVQPDVQLLEQPTSVNATKGSGFTNLRTYLDANQQGATGLGTQVAGNISTLGSTAMQKMGDVNAYADANPTGEIWNTQQAKDAQGAITTATDKASLTQNAGGQNALVRELNPNVSTGGANLNQNLMQNSAQGVQQMQQSVAGVNPLQDLYTKQASTLQENALLRQALARLQQQNMGGQTNPNTTQIYTGTDQVPNSLTGGTISNPYQGLSPDQIAYLKSLQNNFATGGAGGLGNVATGNIMNTVGQALAGAGLSTGQVSAIISGINSNIRNGSTGGGSSGGGGDGSTGSTGGANSNGGYGGPDSVGTGLGGFSLDANGNVTANTTGISNTTANVIGSIIGAITGIPGLGYLGSYLNNMTNNNANTAAGNFSTAISDSNSNINGSVTGAPTATAGQAGTGGQAAAAASVAASAAAQMGYSAEAQAAAAQAAANAAIAGLSAAEISSAAQAAADAADPSTAQAANDAMSEAAAAADAANAADQAAAEAAAADYGGGWGSDTSTDTSTDSDTSSDTGGWGGETSGGWGGSDSDSSGSDSSGGSDSGGDSGGGDSGGGDSGGGDSGGWKTGGYIRGPGTSRSDSIPSWLSDGEYVMKASVVKALGKEFFDKLNNSVK